MKIVKLCSETSITILIPAEITDRLDHEQEGELTDLLFSDGAREISSYAGMAVTYEMPSDEAWECCLKSLNLFFPEISFEKDG
jgi:hypothetical protein